MVEQLESAIRRRALLTVMHADRDLGDGLEELILLTSPLLPDTDVLFLALALTDETVGIVGAHELDLLPDHAWLVNVARGKVCDELAITAALSAKMIAGAALDVTTEEPLSADSPLRERSLIRLDGAPPMSAHIGPSKAKSAACCLSFRASGPDFSLRAMAFKAGAAAS